MTHLLLAARLWMSTAMHLDYSCTSTLPSVSSWHNIGQNLPPCNREQSKHQHRCSRRKYYWIQNRNWTDDHPKDNSPSNSCFVSQHRQEHKWSDVWPLVINFISSIGFYFRPRLSYNKLLLHNNMHFPLFQTFAVFWVLYSYFWVILRRRGITQN
jgi:hypothetical protein